MAEDNNREKMILDFGIEDTVEAGDKELLTGFLGDPDDVKDKDDDKPSSTTNKTTTKAVVKPQPKTKEEEKKDEEPSEEVDVANLFTKEEDKDEEVADNQDGAPNEGDEETEVSIMANLANEFVKLGIFKEDEENPIDPNLTPEEFLKMHNASVNEQVNTTIGAFLSRFGEEYYNMFDAVFVNGVEPQTYLQSFAKLQDIGSLDMTQESSQEKVYKEYLRRQGFPDDRIEARLQKAKVNGDLEEDATEFHKILLEQDTKELENLKEQKEKKTADEQRAKQIFAQNLNKLLVDKVKDKEFDGIPVTEQIAKEAFAYLTHEKYKLSTGEPLTEFDKAILELKRPENHALKTKLALLLMNNLDLTKVKIKEKNEQTRQAFQWATKGKSTTNNSTKKVAPIKENGSFM